MPLSKRAGIEIYLPEIKNKHLQKAFEREFLKTFGGATVIENIKGLYLSSDGKTDEDEINPVYADTPFDFEKNFAALSKYTDELREAALEAKSVLIVV